MTRLAENAANAANAAEQASSVAGAVQEVANTSPAPALTADLHAIPLGWRRWLDA